MSHVNSKQREGVDPRSWTRDTLDLSDCVLKIPAACIEALESVARELGGADLPDPSSVVWNDSMTGFAASVRDHLDRRCGFVILDGLPVEGYTVDVARKIFWLIGRLNGSPFTQSADGSFLYDVRDEGQDVEKGARYAKTNLELTFHTDNARSEVVPDYVGLLCLRPAKVGGRSQLASVYSVREELRGNDGTVLEMLERPFYFDRRGLSAEGEESISTFPILSEPEDELLCRYIRLYIEVGHEAKGSPLTQEQVRALDRFEEVLGRSELHAEFSLERGQILFTNNHWILHNRTEFEDFEEMEKRRHLVRIWLGKDRIPNAR